MEVMQMPLKTWKKIEKVLLTLEDKAEWISEEQAAELLGIQKSTLIKKVCKNEIKPSLYKVSPVTKKRFYDKNKLMGL